MLKKLCIYHGNCADGFTSAWVVRKALGDDVEFYAGVYQNPPPDVEGRDVVMVDFSYKRSVLEEMRDKARSVAILDHHKTAQADLKDLPGVLAIFDMGRSGARITWDHYFPGQKPPDLLLHIEDRDLWRFALRKTREIQASVFAYPYDFKAWDFLMTADLEKLALEGEAIERKHFKDIRELVGVVTRRMEIGGYNVPVANLPYTLSSDAGHLLSKGEPFAACYYDTPDGRCFSLRSAENGVDVSAVAKLYGGGGHKNASGFRVSYTDAVKFEVTGDRP
jgi:oligoribonuclease NrnB/cAMP/cGMP phosphodiesterase (DHH superfamily)